MTHVFENGILVSCDECIIDIKRRLKQKIPFEIKDFRDDPEASRKETLEFIIATLYHSENCLERPHSCRKKITKLLLEHGQFKEEEINEIFDKHSYKSTNYSLEFMENHPEEDFIKLTMERFGIERDKTPITEETKYNFPFSGCDYKMFIGFCRMDVEILKCPDCGNEVMNTPDNVTMGYEHDLVCPFCINNREDEFDTKGLLKPGNPCHHGFWDTQKPEIIYTGTDYFAIFHPKCKKSKREDKKGLMVVNGVWVDESGRVVLGLECIYCGARNALKPFTKGGKIPLLNESGAEWRRVESPILEIINNGESNKVEFKSSLRWDYKQNRANRELEYVIAKSIAGFMNADGGILLIGVDDYKNILGLDKDYLTFGKDKQNRDGFELQLRDVINKYIGKKYQRFIRITFENVYGKEICYVDVRKSPEPIFIKKDGRNEFVVRLGNRTQILDPKETMEYIKMHWENNEIP